MGASPADAEQAAGRVLLTGATGFVGGRLLRKLEESGRPVRRHSSPGPRTIFRTAESPSVTKTMKLVRSKSVPRSSPSKASQ